MDPYDVLQRHGTSPLVSDALDAAGLREQCLGYDICPISTGTRTVGRAFPVSAVPVDRVPDERYARLLEALDAAGPGQVFVLGTDRADRAAAWGELVSTTCAARGVVGTVTDGLARDSTKIRAIEYPVFARGTVPTDIHGRLEVATMGEAITVDGVVVRPGDVVVADDDGVVLVPAPVLGEVAESVLAKKQGEDGFRDAVHRGTLPSDAYRTFNVL